MLAFHLKPLAALVRPLPFNVSTLPSPRNYPLRSDVRNDTSTKSLSRIERDCPLLPPHPPLCGAYMLRASVGNCQSWAWGQPITSLALRGSRKGNLPNSCADDVHDQEGSVSLTIGSLVPIAKNNCVFVSKLSSSDLGSTERHSAE